MKIDDQKLRQILEKMKGDRPRCMKCISTESVAVDRIFGFIVSLCLPHRIEWDWQAQHTVNWSEVVRVNLSWQVAVARSGWTDISAESIANLIERKVSSEMRGREMLARFLGIAGE